MRNTQYAAIDYVRVYISNTFNQKVCGTERVNDCTQAPQFVLHGKHASLYKSRLQVIVAGAAFECHGGIQDTVCAWRDGTLRTCLQAG